MTLPYNRGDLIKFDRSLNISHWAVYVGNDRVVHLTGDASDLLSSGSSSSFEIGGSYYQRASVKEELFVDVAKRDQHSCGNSKYDNEKTALPADMICKRARSKIGEMKFDILFNNCEHFATWCRYDDRTSGQVNTVLKVGGASGFILLLGYLIRRYLF